MAAAFADDPAWGWLMGSDYERLAGGFAGALFDLRVSAGTVWVSDDLAAVAMWQSPDGGAERAQRSTRTWARYRSLAGEQACARLDTYNASLAAVSPTERYWYLGVLATHPARRREGLATAALAPVLGEADRNGTPCCLETSTEANRRFYERRGFTETTVVALPGGPPTWWLRRAPSSQRGDGVADPDPD